MLLEACTSDRSCTQFQFGTDAQMSVNGALQKLEPRIDLNACLFSLPLEAYTTWQLFTKKVHAPYGTTGG